MSERIGFHVDFDGTDIFFAKPSVIVAKTYRKYLEQRYWEKTKEMTWLSSDEMREALSQTRREILDGKFAIGSKDYNEAAQKEAEQGNGEVAEYKIWLVMKDANPTLTLDGFRTVLNKHGDKLLENYSRLFEAEQANAKNEMSR